MLACFFKESDPTVKAIHIVTPKNFLNWLPTQNELTKNWLASVNYKAEMGNLSLIPDATGQLQQVVCCVAESSGLWNVGHLPYALPEGQYFFKNLSEDRYHEFAIAWGLGAYQFNLYKNAIKKPAKLLLPKKHDLILNTVESIYLVRDLINTPTDDMGPIALSQKAAALCQKYGATFREIVGEDLLKQNYASIYTVGRASDEAPRLLDLQWGNDKHPKVTLVGKGVCFDTGGLDIKNSSAMLLMKKDMAGAAHVLGLAQMIMQANLPIKLRILIPAVENAVSGNAYRPGDIIKSRKGITVEIGNTDAEGRVVLSDALTEAVSEKPALLIDIATLTGAARIALGTDLPALFSNQDSLAAQLIVHGKKMEDPMWQLPLFSGYRESLNSCIADINNASMDIYAGAITAALFLKEFVPDNINWAHFDLMAWNLKSKPGRPQGGEAMVIRSLFSYLAENFAQPN